MSNSVIIGRLRAIEGNSTILLEGSCRIHIPPTLSVTQFPIGCSLTVVVHQLSDERLVAEGITRNAEGPG